MSSQAPMETLIPRPSPPPRDTSPTPESMPWAAKHFFGHVENDLAGSIYYLTELCLEIPVIIHNKTERAKLNRP